MTIQKCHQDDPHFDRCFKTHPVFEKSKNNCLKMSQEEHQSIDKQYTRKKEKNFLKQYNLKKPHKWHYNSASQPLGRDPKLGSNPAKLNRNPKLGCGLIWLGRRKRCGDKKYIVY